ncbi:L-alanine-DL-glutamate epimerase [Xaviernesmea oryzae]|uniref:L-alanine-DL-glutamate epimerase n=1 Tax=Xaviernesmea oryzae TaxID=464029 RepID=A0A1X7DX51_9HYPH|nr:mandelate racemase/muconate lactonizing enzyme family protein [Xaviernesmea oryzae]SMF23338.1 L-alanine-DL-glutamate epimerase [Xaviernesmea oryzae]
MAFAAAPTTGDDHRFTIRLVECMVFRVPIDTPVVTSFGSMTNRPALFIRVVDDEGAEGWGEVWCNFPSVGAEHRARLIDATLAPFLIGQPFDHPVQAFERLTTATEVLAIQCGEPGTFAQAVGGLDIAIWDLLARRAEMPLHLFLGGKRRRAVPAYASGINPDGCEVTAAAKREEGYRRFKLKVGFGREHDIGNLRRLRDLLGADTEIMVDANQAWSFDEAWRMSEALSAFSPVWLEEPMRADTPLEDWTRFAASTPLPVALGENLRGAEAFARMVRHGGIRYLQPDVGKWGGLSACLPVARDAISQDVTYCPHWLGGGIGLIASLHLLAAVGGPGMLEVDANPNELKDRFILNYPPVIDGDMLIPPGSGIGVLPDLAALRRYRVDY